MSERPEHVTSTNCPQMQERKLKIVKLTPIALASCERCNAMFRSYQRVEDEAERVMKVLFDRHICEAALMPGEND